MSLIIKMDTIKTEEHLKKAIPYIMNERKTNVYITVIREFYQSRLQTRSL